MAGASVSPRNDKIPVKHRKITLVQAPSAPRIAKFDYADITASENDKRSHRTSDPQTSQILSTADLISALGYAWDRARWPILASPSETNSTCKTEVVESGDVVHYLTEKGASYASTSADQPYRLYLNNGAVMVQKQESLDGSKLNHYISGPRPGRKLFSSWGRVLARSAVIDSSTANCLSHTAIPPNWRCVYRWMSPLTPCKQRNWVNSIENRYASGYIDNCSTSSDRSCIPAGTISTVNNSTLENFWSKPDAVECLDLSSGTASNIEMKPPNNTCSEHEIMDGQLIEEIDCEIISSCCDADSESTKLVPLDHDYENGSGESSSDLHEAQENQGIIYEQAGSELKMGLPAKEKPKYALAKQEHAVAGAMAGVFVSVCLHPIDTVKTVIQSCQANQKPLHIIGSSIIAERGILGLYRGISSNIVSSAPISAVYTYTYESVKKNLLPLLPKEYNSLAHCTAGGCASVATSFIFTPSERIKQQMQVGSHYRNCWNAFIHVFQKGGIPSLYAGWGAVLCRNIPHSVIKFYTYESLKQILLPLSESNAQANVFTTLVSGGLAGSVASLFTTPFDVVKTRLQTQVPGSLTKYDGVLATLIEIGKHEGLKGLYRGLTPRLVMYMIQGALFFASYESFKSLFSLEVPQLSAQTLHEHKNR